jgi:hypothetical protein
MLALFDAGADPFDLLTGGGSCSLWEVADD